MLLTYISRCYREKQVIEEVRAVFTETFVARDMITRYDFAALPWSPAANG